jgi:hypothetical protein
MPCSSIVLPEDSVSLSSIDALAVLAKSGIVGQPR